MGKLNVNPKDRIALEANMCGIENEVLMSGDGEVNKDNLLYHVERVRELQDKLFGEVPEENEGETLAGHAEQPASTHLLPEKI